MSADRALLERVRSARRSLADGGPAELRAQNDFGRVSLPDSEGDVLRDILAEGKARVVIEIGLAYGASALAVAEAIVSQGIEGAGHVIIDAFQEEFRDAGWDAIVVAGLTEVCRLLAHSVFVETPGMRRLLARSQGIADFEHPRFEGRMELAEGETFDFYMDDRFEYRRQLREEGWDKRARRARDLFDPVPTAVFGSRRDSGGLSFLPDAQARRRLVAATVVSVIPGATERMRGANTRRYASGSTRAAKRRSTPWPGPRRRLGEALSKGHWKPMSGPMPMAACGS